MCCRCHSLLRANSERFHCQFDTSLAVLLVDLALSASGAEEGYSTLTITLAVITPCGMPNLLNASARAAQEVSSSFRRLRRKQAVQKWIARCRQKATIRVATRLLEGYCRNTRRVLKMITDARMLQCPGTSQVCFSRQLSFARTSSSTVAPSHP